MAACGTLSRVLQRRTLLFNFRGYVSASPGRVNWLAIETSFDDTSVALASGDKHLYRLTHLRTEPHCDKHAANGGVEPLVAGRAHSNCLGRMVRDALSQTGMHGPQLDFIAVTVGPGIAPSLDAGLKVAKCLAGLWHVSLFPVHHMEAHLLAPRMLSMTKERTNTLAGERVEPAFPYLTLLVSGGHTQLVEARALGQYTVLGSTLDDAVGEAYDKVARTIGLSTVGTAFTSLGALLESTAAASSLVSATKAEQQILDAVRASFPTPMRKTAAHRQSSDFSFSGLKTHVKRLAEGRQEHVSHTLWQRAVADGFQRTVAAHLQDRLRNILSRPDRPAYTAFVISGGVACNTFLRTALTETAQSFHLPTFVPPQWLCTDNAAMIAHAAFERYVAPPKHASVSRLYHTEEEWSKVVYSPTWSLHDV